MPLFCLLISPDQDSIIGVMDATLNLCYYQRFGIFYRNFVCSDEGDSRFYGDTCVLEYRRRTDGMVLENNDTMEIPVALTRFLHPNLKFDVVTTKTFLSMLCRFIENEHRFYRFDVERIGNTIFIQDLPYGDARPFKTYIQGALDILTGRYVSIAIRLKASSTVL
ncbi:unnamed protein product [Gongylonema pulchrum]|uniref:Phospholipid scramblase n=1 Tax=Gongylonema pulchrum TaxID=637853 RepID=A0A183E1S6_9BILA|nr:unnamed protein product [Gongylonema pulchrum]